MARALAGVALGLGDDLHLRGLGLEYLFLLDDVGLAVGLVDDQLRLGPRAFLSYGVGHYISRRCGGESDYYPYYGCHDLI